MMSLLVSVVEHKCLLMGCHFLCMITSLCDVIDNLLGLHTLCFFPLVNPVAKNLSIDIGLCFNESYFYPLVPFKSFLSSL